MLWAPSASTTAESAFNLAIFEISDASFEMSIECCNLGSVITTQDCPFQEYSSPVSVLSQILFSSVSSTEVGGNPDLINRPDDETSCSRRRFVSSTMLCIANSICITVIGGVPSVAGITVSAPRSTDPSA